MPEPDQLGSDQPGPDQPARQEGASLPDEGAGADAPQGLSWSWELDFETLISVLNEPAPWNRPPCGTPTPTAPAGGEAEAANSAAVQEGNAAAQEDGALDQEGSAAAQEDGAAEGGTSAAEDEALFDAILAGKTREIPLAAVAGRVAESLPPSPDLAGWLATTSPKELESGALPGVAASFRRLASWAQAGELAAVAEIASRSAAADAKIGVDDEGRPAWVPDEATAQVSLALAMTRNGASWWTDLATTLTWRLAATGAALAAGHIDLSRARVIAEATGVLDDDTARAVEATVLPGAGDQTTSHLRAALRRAVIAADPEGAEQRRKEAERKARVILYPDEEGTASLTGQNLPGTRAAAAIARISALAQALKASGAGGGIDLLRAQVFIGLLLGTMPDIPAPDGAPDEPPPDDDDENGPPSPRPGETGPNDHSPPTGRPRGDADPGGRPRGGASGGGRPRGGGQPRGGASGGGQPRGDAGRPGGPGDGTGPGGRPGDGAGPDDAASALPPDNIPDPDVPAPSDEDAPGDDFLTDPLGGDPAWAVPLALGGGRSDDDDHWSTESLLSAPPWAALPTLILPSGAGPGPDRLSAGFGPGPPPGGSLDLMLPWATLAGCSPEPGYLGRLGPITPYQAREIAEAAADDPSVRWRIILTSRTGQAIAVTRVPVTRARAGPATWRGAPVGEYASVAGYGDGPGLVGRVTLTIPEDILLDPPPSEMTSDGILARALRAAGREAAAAAARAAADAAAETGCAHTVAALGYRPPPRLREYVVARDLTCRFPFCRQPAWRGDLDHTVPYDQGGKTCTCNLGGLCRHHHRLKQHPGWQLSQLEPGVFRWTTSSGRSYLATPDSHVA